MKSHDVFGIKNEVQVASYIDRGGLDTELSRLLERRQQHVAIRGASKCGKSWLRRRNIENALIVQCRLHRSIIDLYVDALSQLDIRFEVSRSEATAFRGQLKAVGKIGAELLAKIGLELNLGAEVEHNVIQKQVGHDVNDIRYFAELLRASGRQLIIEDFHYLSVDNRRHLAFDLKAFWDYGLYVVVIGIWTQDNLLLSLNPDLAGRMEELSVTWSRADLGRVLDKGGQALNVEFRDPFRRSIIEMSFENVGILQTLVLRALDVAGITETMRDTVTLADEHLFTSAAMYYAEQLNPLYQEFARRVSEGIRRRKQSTGIYAHAMAAILSASDDSLIRGLSATDIFKAANARQPRIQLGNLKAILNKLDALQVDDDGRGLVLTYNPATEKITVVDRQLLMYRSFRTISWPWESLIDEAGQSPESFDGDG